MFIDESSRQGGEVESKATESHGKMGVIKGLGPTLTGLFADTFLFCWLFTVRQRKAQCVISLPSLFESAVF